MSLESVLEYYLSSKLITLTKLNFLGGFDGVPTARSALLRRGTLQGPGVPAGRKLVPVARRGSRLGVPHLRLRPRAFRGR